jgi:hypothetical protein
VERIGKLRGNMRNDIGGPSISKADDDDEVHNEDLVVFEEDDDIHDIIDTI